MNVYDATYLITGAVVIATIYAYLPKLILWMAFS
jgi:hypothetical protein